MASRVYPLQLSGASMKNLSAEAIALVLSCHRAYLFWRANDFDALATALDAIWVVSNLLLQCCCCCWPTGWLFFFMVVVMFPFAVLVSISMVLFAVFVVDVAACVALRAQSYFEVVFLVACSRTTRLPPSQNGCNCLPALRQKSDLVTPHA